MLKIKKYFKLIKKVCRLVIFGFEIVGHNKRDASETNYKFIICYRSVNDGLEMQSLILNFKYKLAVFRLKMWIQE